MKWLSDYSDDEIKEYIRNIPKLKQPNNTFKRKELPEHSFAKNTEGYHRYDTEVTPGISPFTLLSDTKLVRKRYG